MASYSIFTMADIMARESAKLERQGIEMTDLQQKALEERAVSLAIAKYEAEGLLQRLTHPQ